MKIKTFIRLVFLFVLALVVLTPAVPVHAQDNASAAAVDNQVNVIWLLVAALAGTLVGGGGVAVVLARANQNVQLKDSTEQLLANNVPQDTVKLVHNLAEGSQQIAAFLIGQFKYAGVPGPIANAIKEGAGIAVQAADFVAAVTDGKPNAPTMTDAFRQMLDGPGVAKG